MTRNACRWGLVLAVVAVAGCGGGPPESALPPMSTAPVSLAAAALLEATPPEPTPAGPPPAAAATPAPPATTVAPAGAAPPSRPEPQGAITLPAKLGSVRFDHGRHVGELKVACATCHHASLPAKPLAAKQQACRDCHTMPAQPPLTTSLQAAFHDPKAGSGTCISCHQEAVANGRKAPLKCMECHRRAG